MADTIQDIPIVELTGAAATVYTAPNGAATDRAVVRRLVAHNKTALAATLTVSKGTDASARRIADAVTIPPKGYWTEELIHLDNGEVIQAFGGTAAAFNMWGSVIEVV